MNTASTKSKRRKKWLVIITLLVVVPFVGFLYFFAASEPPITKGPIEYNLEYKKDLRLDVYLPTKQVYEQSPVVLYVHGGAWIAGRKEAINMNRFNEAINRLRAEGYAVVSPEYTLATGDRGPFPYCVQDVYDVVTWIKEHAEDYQFDLNNLGIFGESAGAHISMLVAFAEPSLFVEDFDLVPFQYVVDIYGPAQLEGIYHSETLDTLNSLIADLPETLRSRLDIAQQIFGFDPSKDTARAQHIIDLYSPHNHVHAKVAPSLLIQGDQDRLVPVQQSIALQAKMDSLGVPNELHILEGVDHAFAGANQAQRDSLQQWIFDFVTRHYQSRP